MDEETRQEVKEMAQAFIEELKEPIRKFTPGDNGSDEDKGEQSFKSFGEQLVAVYRAETFGEVDPRLKATGLSEGIPSEGGFLVRTDFSNELIKRTYETGILVPLCQKIGISPNSNGLKLFGVDETSRATGSRWGGIQVYWLDEAGEKTASKPKFRMMELGLKKLIGLCYATDELLQDAVALESVIMQGFAEEFGFRLDDAIVRGTGVGQPQGILNANCLITTPKETGQAADTIITENILKMWKSMWPSGRRTAVWLYNQELEDQLETLSYSIGTAGVLMKLFTPPLGDSPYGKIKGRPAIAIEQASGPGDVGDIMLVDLSQYLLIDKGPVQTATSIHVKFVYDETAFRFVYRVDGQPKWNSKVTPYKRTSSDFYIGPFITLEAR